MLLLAVGADEDLLALTHRDGPWRRTFHGIRLNPPTPITRHGSILMDNSWLRSGARTARPEL